MTRKSVSVARNQGWLLFSAVFGMGTTLALTIIVGRNASLETLGLFALVGALISLARDITDLGSSAVATRDATRDPAQEPTILGQLLVWRLCLSTILACVCLGLATRRDLGVDSALLGLTAVVILLAFYNGLFAVFQLRQLQHIPATLNIAANSAALVAVIAILLSGASLLLTILVIILREAFIVIANRSLALRHLDERPRLATALRTIRKWGNSSISIYALAALCWHLMLNSGTFIVDLMLSDEDLGIYMAAFRLVTPLFGIGWLLTVPLMAVFAYAYKTDRGAFSRQTQTALGLALGTGALLAVIGVHVSHNIIAMVYGSAFDGHVGALAAGLLRWFMLAFAATMVIAVIAPAMLAQGAERKLARLASVMMCIAVLAAIFAARQGEIVWIAAAIALGMSISAGVATVLMGGWALVSLGLSLVPAVLATLALANLPATSGDLVHLGWGIFLAIAGLAVLWLRPGLTAYRCEQDKLAALARKTVDA